jgi:D-alanyl-D-alanine carboxypeptidase (penicillin-binding protein 5/6)
VGSGFESKNSRSRESAKILNWGLKKFDTVQIIKKDEIFTSLNVWLGKKKKVEVISNESFYITISKRKKKTIKAILEYEGPISTPIKEGDKLAVLKVYLSDELEKEIDIFAAEDVKKSNIFSRLFNSLNYLVWGDV